jgi:hypothetical protein
LKEERYTTGKKTKKIYSQDDYEKGDIVRWLDLIDQAELHNDTHIKQYDYGVKDEV